MLNFEYQNPTKVLFGKGQIAKISHEILPMRILIVYGGGVLSPMVRWNWLNGL